MARAEIAPWHCHLCGKEFSTEDGGLCRSCNRATCEDCWGDGRSFLPTRQSQRQCKACTANSATADDVRRRSHYFYVFLGAAPTITLLLRYVNSGAARPLPWWPHTLLIGGILGALVAFALARLSDFPNGSVDQ